MESLTEKEKQEIEQLKFGFNKVKYPNNENYLSSKRIEVSKPWIKVLLKISFVLNVGTILSILIAAMFVMLKPPPSYYASTPSGKVIPLQTLKR